MMGVRLPSIDLTIFLLNKRITTNKRRNKFSRFIMKFQCLNIRNITSQKSFINRLHLNRRLCSLE